MEDYEDAVKKALEFLECAQREDGTATYYASEDCEYRTVDASDLYELGAALLRGEQDAYTDWSNGDLATPEEISDLVEVEVGAVTDYEEVDTPDALCAYVTVHVRIDGVRYDVSAYVGAPESDHATIRSSGGNMSPFIAVWWADPCDYAGLAAGIEGLLLDRLNASKFRLWREFREMLENESAAVDTD